MGKLNLRKINLLCGKKIYKEIIKRIQNSSKSIIIQMFVWRDDKIGNEILKELLIASKRGVKIFISKEINGSIYEKAEQNKKSLFHKKTNCLLFKQKVIEYAYKRPKIINDSRKNELLDELIKNKNVMYKNVANKDHSKYFIFDDQVLITGGANIGDEYLYSDIENILWTDCMIEFFDKEIVEDFKKKLNGLEFSNKKDIEFVINSKRLEKFEIKEKIIKLLEQTKRKIIIQVAYLGDKEILRELIKLSNRGVKITLIISKKSNLQNDLNYKFTRTLMQRTKNSVNVYLCKNMVHNKTLYIDNKISFIGSANLNKLSMKELDEMNIIIRSNKSFNQKVEEDINRKIRQSKKVKNFWELKYNKFYAFIESLVS
jgi:cardiolipin synthase A/B